MDHRVGRAPDGRVDADGVLERRAGEKLGEDQVLAGQRETAGPPGGPACVRSASTAGRSRRCPAGRRPGPRSGTPSSRPCPCVMQWPCQRAARLGGAELLARSRPARTSSLTSTRRVPEPIGRPLVTPAQHRPAGTPIVGRFTLAAPITIEGVVLSQPTSSTTPSSGLARMVSSTSMLARLRYIAPSGASGSPPGRCGKLQGAAAGRQHAVVDGFGDPPQVRVARRQFGPAVGECRRPAGRRTGRRRSPRRTAWTGGRSRPSRRRRTSSRCAVTRVDCSPQQSLSGY